MTPNKLKVFKDISSEEVYQASDIEDIYQSAMSSYGYHDSDYAYDNYDMDNYGYES